MSTCPACANQKSGLYVVTCTQCALRLIESTPRHGARAAMWAHLKRSLTDEQWLALRAAHDEAGHSTQGHDSAMPRSLL